MIVAHAEEAATPDADGGGVAVEEPVVQTRSSPRHAADASSRTRRQPPYNVVVLNDEEHTFEYVIELLTKLFGHSLTLAEKLTWQIHNSRAGHRIDDPQGARRAEVRAGPALRAGPPDGDLQGPARLLHRAGARGLDRARGRAQVRARGRLGAFHQRLEVGLQLVDGLGADPP